MDSEDNLLKPPTDSELFHENALLTEPARYEAKFTPDGKVYNLSSDRKQIKLRLGGGLSSIKEESKLTDL